MATRLEKSFASAVSAWTQTRFGLWFCSRWLHRFDRSFRRLTGSKKTLTGILTGLPVVMVTTRGAKTGIERTLPLVYVRVSSQPVRIALIASNWGQRKLPAWYYNLKANPEAVCAFEDGRRISAIACEAEGSEYARIWQEAASIYPGYEAYRQRAGRRIPILILDSIVDER